MVSTSKDHMDEIDHKKLCSDASLVLESRKGDYPEHYGPYFLVAKQG